MEAAIQDYNALFGTNYETSADKFQNYYKDVSLRMKNRELTLQDIDRAIKSSPQMRDKKELIDAFVKSITPSSDVDDDWNTFVRTKMQEEINDIIKTEHLKDAPARKFIHDSFDNGYVQTEGTGIADIMPPLNPFKKNAGERGEKSSHT